MSGKLLGQITHYYDHRGVAVLRLAETLRLGEHIYIQGHTTHFHQKVTSLEINHRAVAEAHPGQDVALQVIGRVRPHDSVYRSTAEETTRVQFDELMEILK